MTDTSQPEQRPKTWDEVRTWDDVVSSGQREILDKLKETLGKFRCSCLRRAGDYFYYCEARAKQLAESGCFNMTDMPSPLSARYQAAVDTASLQLWCLDRENYKTCINLRE